jgi:adenine deaminase
MTSVPPWIGSASGTALFSSSASVSERGLSTSTAELYGSADMLPSLARRLAVARGDEPADLVVRGGKVLSVFTREWLDVDVAIVDGYIAGLGEYEGREQLDASGHWVVPGFVDAHMHLESSKLLPDEFARLVLPFGTTAVVADPHEMANVLGTDGVHWLLDATAELALDVYFTASSCVPASVFESPRRAFTPGDIESLLRRRRVIGLAEMMNFPGVIAGDARELAKLALATHVDGHAPGVLGRDLMAYAAAGIQTDHEATTEREGRERLRAGMWLLIRQGSAARNLQALVPLLAEFGPSRIAFCTDDREAEHIAQEGHINSMVRDAVAAGVTVEDALIAATLSPCLCHGLERQGALAPGYQADLVLLPDLTHFVPAVVMKDGHTSHAAPRATVPDWATQTVRIDGLDAERLRLRWREGRAARVIGVIPGQIVTESLIEEPAVRSGEVVADPARDLAKIAVVERHLGTGRVGVGLVRGFGLDRGALASTIAHDAHNIVVVGMDDTSMATAVARVALHGGGIVATDGETVLAELPLPVAGLLSDAPHAEVVAASRALLDAARTLGCRLEAPYNHMAFLALSVIPHLKLTDHGLVDVDRFELVPLEAT